MREATVALEGIIGIDGVDAKASDQTVRHDFERALAAGLVKAPLDATAMLRIEMEYGDHFMANGLEPLRLNRRD